MKKSKAGSAVVFVVSLVFDCNYGYMVSGVK